MKLHYMILASALLVAACGETKQDRVASGALIGATAGGIVGATTGSWGTGAVVGGALGAGAGAVTDEADVNLGRPWWR